MKSAVSKIVASVVFIIMLSNLYAENKEIKWYNFNEAVSIAKKENKHILVDFYTDWCVWCKKLESEVYSKPEIIKFMNDNFVAVKLNPEKAGEIDYKGDKYSQGDFAQAAGVTGYPATGFFSPESDYLQIVPGFLPADQFMSLLKYFQEQRYYSLGFQDYVIFDKFRSLLKDNPEDAEINFVVGYFEQKVLKNNSKAIGYYKKAIKDQISSAYAGLSEIAAENNNNDGSKKWMDKAKSSGYVDENTTKNKIIEIVQKYMKNG